MARNNLTTAQRSQKAKEAHARRQADKALGIPSIAAYAAAHHEEMEEIGCSVSKANARRYAVRRIEILRQEAAARAAWANRTRDLAA